MTEKELRSKIDRMENEYTIMLMHYNQGKIDIRKIKDMESKLSLLYHELLNINKG